MAKRFTDTDKWKRPWFEGLPLPAKLTWLYVLDNCDHAGVWPASFGLLSYQVGFKVTQEKFEKWFGDKIRRFDGDKYFIESFIDFQYGGVENLKPTINTHRYVLSFLEKLRAEEPLLNTSGSVVEEEEEEEEEVKEEGECEGEIAAPAPKRLSPSDQLVEIWNRACGDLPKVRGASGKRKDSAAERWEEKPDADYWADIVRAISQSQFCNGQNTRGWKADFDFLIRPDTQHKVLEGKYQDRKAGPQEHVDPEVLKLRRQAEEEMKQLGLE